MAFDMVTSSAYSRSEPTGMPMAMRVTRTPSGLSKLRQIHRGGFAFGRGIRRDDDFFDRAALEPLDQALDFELIGTNALQRRERAAEHVVEAAELARLLDGLNVRGLFHDANDCAVARGAGAEVARIGVRDVVADRALADFFLGFADRVGKRERLLAVHAQQIECEALRRLLPDSRQALQFIDQSSYGRRKIRH